MSEFIRAQTQVLFELKKIEEKVGRLQLELDRFPAESNRLTSSLNGKKEELDNNKNFVESAEKTLRKSEIDLKEMEDKLRKAEDKMREVKTNEEFQAAIKENDTQKREKATLEELVLKLMNELDGKRKSLRELDKTYQAFADTVKKELEKIESERQGVAQQLEQFLAVRQEKSSSLSGEVAALFKRVTIRTRGAAVVTAENGLCHGCNMKIRPQIYNEVLGFKAIHPCPNCGRIILIGGGEEPSSEAAAR